MSNSSLQNINNYNKNFINSISEIYIKYITVVTEYLSQINDTLYIKNIIYLKYIINTGIETISHIFKILLLYTKNLDICYFYSQKAFYYYIEFIGQIIKIDEEHQSYLQLNCKDALLFVYKKTIFEINNDFKKNFKSNKHCNVMNNITILISIYNNSITNIINNISFNPNIKYNLIEIVENKLSDIVKNIINIINCINVDELYNYINLINHFNNNNYYLDNNDIKYMLVKSFTQFLIQSNLNSDTICNNINIVDIEPYLENSQNNNQENYNEINNEQNNEVNIIKTNKKYNIDNINKYIFFILDIK